jgi:hypothetical protein
VETKCLCSCAEGGAKRKFSRSERERMMQSLSGMNKQELCVASRVLQPIKNSPAYEPSSSTNKNSLQASRMYCTEHVFTKLMTTSKESAALA